MSYPLFVAILWSIMTGFSVVMYIDDPRHLTLIIVVADTVLALFWWYEAFRGDDS